MTRYARLMFLSLIVLTLGLAACGGGDEEGGNTTATTGGGGGGTLQIMTSEGISYDETSLDASAGEVTIDYTNNSGLPHNVTVEGPGVEDEATDTITEGDTSVTVDLQAGEYTFYCSVDSHREQGMEGTLVVE
jgi:plastocyanin